MRRGLGDLPDEIGRERGEQPQQPPYGFVRSSGAPAGVGVPTGYGIDSATKSPAPMAHNQSTWQTANFTAGLTPIKIQDWMLRKFLIIQNRASTGVIYVGFGWVPTLANGLILPAGVSYEPYSYPVNEIYVLGSIAGVSGLLIWGV